MQEEIIRAKYLVLKGRFQNRVTKVKPCYEKLDSKETITIGGQVYAPYYDHKRKQVIYAYADNNTLYSLICSNADYGYGTEDNFEWFGA